MQKIQSNYKRLLVFFYILVVVVTYISCATRSQVSSFSRIGKNDVLIVGKVIVEPPIPKWDIQYSGMTFGVNANEIAFYCQDELTPIQDLEITYKVGKDSIKVDRGKTFFVKSPNKSFYFYYGYVLMQTTNYGEKIYWYLPAGWKANIQPGDKAIYIGTIKYTRDEFYRVVKAEIIDEYDTVLNEYNAKFGDKVPLKKALLIPIKD